VVSPSVETLTCTVDGCGAKAHGRGLCRVHYDEHRYLATIGRDPEIQAKAARESRIESELRYGSVPDWASPHGNGSMFATDDDRRAAWDERPEALMQEYADRGIPGHRPWDWWHYFAERSQHVIGYDDYRRLAEGQVDGGASGSLRRIRDGAAANGQPLPTSAHIGPHPQPFPSHFPRSRRA
jgi:hypothetical protein